jgi:glycosyltransferase involved in cell wall biosynthesis
VKRDNLKISVIIPALNEQESIGLVIKDIPHDIVDEIIVVDNGSTDKTAEVARICGARIVSEKYRGYGKACQAGITYADHADIIVFLDGDYSDYPEEIEKIIAPIIHEEADLVIGSRISGGSGNKVLLPQAYWGNRLATWLIYKIYHYRFTDLGPFRAIRYDSLKKLDMRDNNFGWTIEMQIKAVQQGLRIKEIKVSYRTRVGRSKISGTITGTIKAGWKILYTIFKLNYAS